ncbi:MAG: cytochrome b N-terminal domain-containing protein [Verrucomicrobiota bacterium]|jgi:ubiquinol-cytochrome c reductase cytochrome b subunit
MNSLRKLWAEIDDRTGISGLVKPMLDHLVPPDSKWWYVFGSATMIAFMIQVVTGIALATVYAPTAGHAYDSLKYITEEVPFGRLVRGMHYFGASFMVIFVVVHMVRVFMMAAYKYPRETNWLTGVVLLGLTVTMGFTGQLLRWDQNAIWSSVVGASQAARTPVMGKWLAHLILSGDTVSSATLSHIFAIHVFVLPGLVMAFIGFHVYLVMRHGISEPPKAGNPVDPQTYRQSYHDMLNKVGKPFWPYAAWRDVVFGTLAVIAIVALAWWIGPPALDAPADPTIVEARPAPDWYLLWYFAVLALVPHRAEDYVILLAPALMGLALFSVPFLNNRGERSWRRRPWAVVTIVFAGTCIGVLWLAGAREDWTPNFAVKPLPATVIGPDRGPVHAGGIAFNEKGCMYCHAVSGYGGKRGPDLTSVGARLSRDQIVIRILSGGYDMPAYANNLTTEQLDNLTAFLQSRKAR